MAWQHPNRRVALVTFSSDVTIFGDGMSEPRTLAGTRLENYEELVAAGSSVELTAPVKDTAGALVDKVYAVSEGGSTALGPAVLTAVAMASASAGSRVRVCGMPVAAGLWQCVCTCRAPLNGWTV